ncbi:MAG: HAMP domain-containing protein [Clostridia bacterium]|nr:HAMP domain-containing protein [Clostridia bacterium]
MEKLKKKLNSIRIRLFLSLCVVVIIIITFLIIVNNFILETFYLYSKTNTLKLVYDKINIFFNDDDCSIEEFKGELEKISINNNFEILIKTGDGITTIYNTNRDYLGVIKDFNRLVGGFSEKSSILVEETGNFDIKKVKDTGNNINYLMLSGTLDNGYMLFIRIPITSIQESVRISNKFLYLIAIFVIILGGAVVSFVSRKFTKPILELNSIAKKMSNLDFSQKYQGNDEENEIDTLGQSINTMSQKLETTIKQLRATNRELEKDVEEKSKLNEMKNSFISDVSHELKTPIALVQGYSEGLLENVNTDEESRKFYAEVILDEANKMDRLVKQLLELMKLEYDMREFNNKTFDIIELEKEIIRKSQVMLEEKKADIKFDSREAINVIADDFYIDQVITNYITNAIKHVEEIDGEKYISIKNEIIPNTNKVRVSVFNTGKNIEEEDLERIWNRFYKADESRNRNDGGTGIGLSLVKAIMNNYGNNFGVINRESGVEFFFEI